MIWLGHLSWLRNMIWMGHLSWLKNNLDGSFEPVEKQDLVGSLFEPVE